MSARGAARLSLTLSLVMSEDRRALMNMHEALIWCNYGQCEALIWCMRSQSQHPCSSSRVLGVLSDGPVFWTRAVLAILTSGNTYAKNEVQRK